MPVPLFQQAANPHLSRDGSWIRKNSKRPLERILVDQFENLGGARRIRRLVVRKTRKEPTTDFTDDTDQESRSSVIRGIREIRG